jgi:uncharacterized membrane protein YfcA
MSVVVAAGSRKSALAGLGWGSLIGTLGGLIGLGGAEFRLPVLVSRFGLPTLEAVIINKAMSLVVVAFALVFRANTIPFDAIWAHREVVLNLLGGSLIGAWWAAGHAMRLSRRWLDRIVLVLLVGLAFVMLTEHALGWASSGEALIGAGGWRIAIGIIVGFGIGTVAALLGVAGGELLIPTIVLLFGLDIKLAGSLSLAVSLPTMVVGFARYGQSEAFSVVRRERLLLLWMAVGSVLGAALGSLLLTWAPTDLLGIILGIILLISAIKIFRHRAH